MTQHDEYKPETELEKPEEQHSDTQQTHQSDSTDALEEKPKDTLPNDDSPNATGGDDSLNGTGGNDSPNKTGGDDSPNETGGDDLPNVTEGNDVPNGTGGNDSPNGTEGEVKTSKAKDSLPKKPKGRPRKNSSKEPIVERNDVDVDDLTKKNNKRLEQIEREKTVIEEKAKKDKDAIKKLENEEKQLEKENDEKWREQQKNKQKKLSWLICQAKCEKKGISHLAEGAPLDILSKKELLKIKEIAEKKPAKYRDLLTAIRQMEEKD